MPNTDKPNYRVRRAAHSKLAAELKARKKIRGVRAEIHEAMLVAAAMKRSKKKGTGDLDANMEALGFARVTPDGQQFPPENKFNKLDGIERAEAAGRRATA
jgi:hypothetical protein